MSLTSDVLEEIRNHKHDSNVYFHYKKDRWDVLEDVMEDKNLYFTFYYECLTCGRRDRAVYDIFRQAPFWNIEYGNKARECIDCDIMRARARYKMKYEVLRINK